MRAVVVVDDRVDRRTPRSGTDGRPVDLVAALSRVAAANAGTLSVELVGWRAVAEGTTPPALAGADLVHVIPGSTHSPASLDELLAELPAGIPTVVSVPDRPPLPRFAGRSRQPSRRWSDRLVRAGSPPAPGRPVWAVTTEPVEDGYVAATTGTAQVGSASWLGPGYDPPALAPAHDAAGPVVLAVTTDRETAEAVEVLRAAELLGRRRLRPLLVLAGCGPDQAAVGRAVAFAEAAGVRVRLLGRPGRRELARWRATATAAVVTDREPGRGLELASLLMGGVPVAAPRTRDTLRLAARSTVAPAWYEPGQSTELAGVLTVLLDDAARAAGRLREPGPASGLSVVPPVRPALHLVEPAAGDAASAGADPTGDPAGGYRHCLPTWDEVAEEVVALWCQAVLAAVPVDPLPTLAPLPTLGRTRGAVPVPAAGPVGGGFGGFGGFRRVRDRPGRGVDVILAGWRHPGSAAGSPASSGGRTPASRR